MTGARPGGESATRPGVLGWLVGVLSIGVTLAAVAWAADLFRAVGLLLYTQQYLAGMLALALPLTFLTTGPDRRGQRPRPPWFDLVAALAGALAAGFMAVRYPTLSELVSERPVDGIAAGTTVLLLVVECLRRTTGHVLTAVVVGFIVLGFVGHLLPASLAGREMEADYLLYYLSWDPNGLLGTPMVVVSTIVIAFVLFGKVLLAAGGSEFFTDLSMALVGRYRGGHAKIAVTASALFGSISGSAVSNVATTGVITIPLMQRAGYRATQAGAIEAVASTGGQLMPPIMGAAAFLMAEFLQIPYTAVVIAAVVPAVLYYVALFVVADLEAARRGVEPADPAEIPRLWDTLKNGWYFPVPFVVLIVLLFVLNRTPEFSALASAAALAVLAAAFRPPGRRLTPRALLAAVRDAGTAVLDIIMIGAAAGFVIGVLSITGLGFALTLSLVGLGAGGLTPLLLAAAGLCIVLGMGMPTAGVYILLSALVAPALVEAGIGDLAAHLFILYFGMMSMITPPVAIAAFAAASLTGADAMRTAFESVRFGWIAYLIPFLIVASPSFVLEGPAGTIALDIATALLGIWLASAGLVGYLAGPLDWRLRGLATAIGVAAIIPPSIGGTGSWIGMAGVVASLAFVTARLLAERRRNAGASRGPATRAAVPIEPRAQTHDG